MKKIAIILPFIFLLWGCNTAEKQIALKNNEVMEVHDESMLKMDEIYTLSEELQVMKEGLAADSLTENNPLQEEVLQAITDLKVADDAMMDWMHDYQPPAKGAPFEATIKSLEDQLQGIIKVDQSMDEAIQKAKNLLEKAPKD